ncbi:NAD(P)H-hydrate dehydratase [Desulfosoma caldarium]|uniref:Bifunctional NAD(P)H-hydrate repair enzyme n=1 Tax=Desulfosoma caldarium TaxID=610254 RepID=A0A3N1VS44_9BACT|nr:NAD(P)H-hydrate dehydratase [Desulfosoma caldarium]ROR03062.1 NAD(P)H-hydrate epimerase [Desulfosoma caldarium]
MILVTAQEMAELDRRTIEEIGLPGAVLMENAARGALAFFERVMPDLARRRVVVLAGSGNNAGDGFVIARLLHGKGVWVRVVCLRPAERLRGDALLNYRILEKIGVQPFHWNENEDFSSQFSMVRDADVIIDALLGTGLSSPVQGLYRDIIEAVNALQKPVLAVDLPSGLDASTGKVLGAAIRATATATFGLPKVGQRIGEGDALVGALHVVDIGIPPCVVASAGVTRWWLDEELCRRWLSPRPAETHKGRAGHVCLLAGSPGKTGAATLASLGAARVGAGLVTLFVPRSLNPILEVKLTEAMTLPIPETSEHSASIAAETEILDFLHGKQALAVGPGISLHPETQSLLLRLISRVPCPLVLDADALTILAGALDTLGEAPVPVIVTPHPGEMARLMSCRVADVQADRLQVAQEFSRQHGVIVLLKGHRTVIASPEGRVAINGSGTPAMASGGMGDVLTGMIAGFLAQGVEPFQAACLAAYIHGKAAENVCQGKTTRGLLASDLLEHIPLVIGALETA